MKAWNPNHWTAREIPIPTKKKFFSKKISFLLEYSWASLVAQTVKSLPAMKEMQVQSPGWQDLLEKGMATHSSILAWRIQWAEEPGGLQSTGLQRVGHNWATNNTYTVDLQCYVSFRGTAKWISKNHNFLDSFPIQAITEYWTEFPVL